MDDCYHYPISFFLIKKQISHSHSRLSPVVGVSTWEEITAKREQDPELNEYSWMDDFRDKKGAGVEEPRMCLFVCVCVYVLIYICVCV